EWVVGVVGFLILGGLYFWNRQDRKAKLKKRIAEEKQKLQREELEKAQLAVVVEKPQNPLCKTEECLNSTDCTDFYKLLNVEFKQWLAEKFSLEIQDLNSKKIAAAFDKSGIDN